MRLILMTGGKQMCEVHGNRRNVTCISEKIREVLHYTRFDYHVPFVHLYITPCFFDLIFLYCFAPLCVFSYAVRITQALV